jgi:hypothetical protein
VHYYELTLNKVMHSALVLCVREQTTYHGVIKRRSFCLLILLLVPEEGYRVPVVPILACLSLPERQTSAISTRLSRASGHNDSKAVGSTDTATLVTVEETRGCAAYNTMPTTTDGHPLQWLRAYHKQQLVKHVQLQPGTWVPALGSWLHHGVLARKYTE